MLGMNTSSPVVRWWERGRQLSRHRRGGSNAAADRLHAPAGDFAALFARRARTPLRVFLPKRRAWVSLGAAAGVMAVLTGVAMGIPPLHLGAGSHKTQKQTDTLSASAQRNAVTRRNPGERSGGAPAAGPQNRASDSPSPTDAASTPAAPPGSPEAPAPVARKPPLTPQAATGTQRDTTRLTDTTVSADATLSSAPALSVRKSVDTGGNQFWAQDTVSVTSTVPLRALKISVRVAQTGGVASTGTWSSLAGKVRVDVASNSTGVDYLLTLNSGVTLAPGTYVFEAQYNHSAATRDARHDIYAVTATPANSQTSEGASGHF